MQDGDFGFAFIDALVERCAAALPLAERRGADGGPWLRLTGPTDPGLDTGFVRLWAGEDPVDRMVQARLRGSFIWMLANLHGHLLLATSNKSEAAVGYTTMDGDTSGGIAPIADVPKCLVTAWLAWAERFHDLGALSTVNVLQPTAELRPPERAQTDEADLITFR